jgi:hypothetical protein
MEAHVAVFPCGYRSAKHWSKVLPSILCFMFAGCHSRSVAPRPSVEISRVPSAIGGGPERMDVIEGRVKGTKPSEQIVLYARNGVWWIQPFRSRPFTAIQDDSTWKGLTHLGTEYAALLVEQGYNPDARITELPKEGNGIVAIVTLKGSDAPVASNVIHFSGYDWKVRSAPVPTGGDLNSYAQSNVWTDEKGYLHLRMRILDGHWSCAEVNLTRSLGYGTYKFVVQDSAHLDPSNVLGMFTLDEAADAETRSELDIELSRWGKPNFTNGQYVVQPYYIPQNVSHFAVTAGPFTHILRWEPGLASFRTIRGSVDVRGLKSIAEHSFTSGIPTAGSETVHLNLYDFHPSTNGSQQPAEVVIEKFEYVP